MPLAIESVAHVLKRDTHAQHEAVESLMHPLLALVNTTNDFARFLETFFGYYHPLQDTISRFITPSHLEDIEERRHASLILKDLDSLGFSFQGELCTDLPIIDNVAAAFGALYVLEGSTLGGRMISKILLKNDRLGLSPNNLRFFDGYGNDTGPKWQFFVHILNQQGEVPVIVDAANKTFFYLKQWVLKTLYARTN